MLGSRSKRQQENTVTSFTSVHQIACPNGSECLQCWQWRGAAGCQEAVKFGEQVSPSLGNEINELSIDTTLL